MEKLQWDELIHKDRESYLRSRPKRGLLVEHYLLEKGESLSSGFSILEEGCFSAKDSLYLEKRFPNADFYVLDLELEAMKLIESEKCQRICGSAFDLPLADKSIDISFHSGVIILFEDQRVKDIIKEQCRITERYAFIFGHNQWNFVDILVSYFKRVVKNRKIFNFRRFTASQLESLSPIPDKTRVCYVDNMVVNVCKRNCPSLMPWLERLGLTNLSIFANEIMMVIELDD